MQTVNSDGLEYDLGTVYSGSFTLSTKLINTEIFA